MQNLLVSAAVSIDRNHDSKIYALPNRRLDYSLKYFENYGTMEMLNAAELLAALGHDSRLAIFRLLIEAGPQGMNASSIGESLRMAPATLSFHLAHLSRVGLISGQRESRFIHYSANYETMDDLIAFLTHNCCQGEACLPKTTGCNTTVKRRTGTARKSA